MNNRKVRILVEGAMAAALALALSYVRIWRMPQGGSITLENVPLFLFTLRWGLKAGLGAGSVAGLLQLILGGTSSTLYRHCWTTPWPFPYSGWHHSAADLSGPGWPSGLWHGSCAMSFQAWSSLRPTRLKVPTCGSTLLSTTARSCSQA